MKKFVIVLLISLLLLQVSYALTASVSNARMILYTEVGAGQTQQINKTITINNPNNISVHISLSPRGDLEGRTEFNENNFVLQPNESKHVTFTTTLTSGGDYEGRIAISFTPSDPNVKSQGVGIASVVIIHAEGPVTGDTSPIVDKEDTQPVQNTALTENTPNTTPNDTTPKDTEDEDTGVTVSPSRSRPSSQTSSTKPIESNNNIIQKPERNLLVGLLVMLLVAIVVFLIYMAISRRYNKY